LSVQIKFIAAIFAALSFLALAPSSGEAQNAAATQNPRIALIIGNAAYPDHPLATPANDAGLVAQTLQAAGFEVVGARDLDSDALRGALRDLLAKAAAIGPDMQAFVYLSGRGVQYDGDNYFVPIDAQIARDADIPIQAIKVSDFSRALAATPGRARIIVLDAARASSFAADGSALAGGLGLVDPEDGTLMAFNAAPGTIAADEPGPYGVYGKSLAGAMREGGLPIEDVFAQVRLQVNQQSNGALVPWSVSKVKEPYSIFERAPDAPPPPALVATAAIANRPFDSIGPDEAYSLALQRDTLGGYQEYLAAYPSSPQARRVRAILAARREAIFWRRTVDANSPRAYWTYLRVYPNGPHVPDAQRRLDILSAQFAPPPDFAPLAYADLPPPPPDELVYDTGPAFVFDGPDYGPPPPPPPYAFLPVEDDGWRDLPPPPPPAGVGYLPVLSVAIPLLIGAKLFHDRGAVQAQQNVGAPPPLPPGFKPQDHAPVVPAGQAPAGQPLNARRPLPAAPGATPAIQPLSGARPLPAAPAVAPAIQPLNGAKPLPAAPGVAPAVQPPNGAKALPATPGVAPAIQPLNGAKPLPAAPGVAPAVQPSNGAKALPAAPGVAPRIQPLNGAKPLPTPSGAAAPVHAAEPGAPLKPLPAPTQPIIVKPGEQPVVGPKPLRPELKAAPPLPQAVKPEPLAIKPAPQLVRPAPQIVKPAPQVVRPAPIAAPVQHVAPPPPAAPPVQRAPPPVAPPVQHVAPPPPAAPPVQRAPPPPVAPPAQHAPPPAPHPAAPPPGAGKRPVCGAPNTPPCPK
jgi:uncharacterized caspase-like protein